MFVCLKILQKHQQLLTKPYLYQNFNFFFHEICSNKSHIHEYLKSAIFPACPFLYSKEDGLLRKKARGRMNEQASEIVKVLKLGPLASKHFCYANDDLWKFFVNSGSLQTLKEQGDSFLLFKSVFQAWLLMFTLINTIIFGFSVHYKIAFLGLWSQQFLLG